METLDAKKPLTPDAAITVPATGLRPQAHVCRGSPTARVTPQKDRRFKSVVISRCRFVDRPTMQAAASSREGTTMKRPHALWGAAPLGGHAVRPWAGRLPRHPSERSPDRSPPHRERLLGARRHPLDDAAARAPAVPDDTDDEARARHPGHRPCPLAPLLRGGRTPSGEAGMVPLRNSWTSRSMTFTRSPSA
jgi:hypothetical protein